MLFAPTSAVPRIAQSASLPVPPSAGACATGAPIPIGVPPIVVGATGEVRFCSAGMVQLAQSIRKAVLAAAAEACGGEDKYAVMGEMMADATGSFMGVDVQCTGNSGCALVFKCLGAKSRPSGFTK